MATAQIQFSLIKKNKDWTSRSLANLPPPYVWQHLIFALTPRPLKVDVICVSPLTWLKCHLWHASVNFTDQSIMQRGDPRKVNFESLEYKNEIYQQIKLKE